MVLGMKSGLDTALIYEVISGSPSSSAMFEVRSALMVSEAYTTKEMNISVPLKDSQAISNHTRPKKAP